MRAPRVSLKPKTPFSLPLFDRQQAQMTYERRTANERKTMTLELTRIKAEEEPADFEAAGPSHRPTTSEPEISVGDFVRLFAEDGTLQKPSIFLGRVQANIPAGRPGALTICMGNPEIPGRIQMECFIPVKIFRKKNITFFPFFPKRPKFSVHLCGLLVPGFKWRESEKFTRIL